MKKFINRLTGSVMWVDDSRVEEYKALGHRPADQVPEKEPAAVQEKKPAAKKARKKK